MATNEPTDNATLPQQNFSPLAGLLSYLVPGLGQIVQGRIGKGLLFFFSLYFLFFYGQYLGNWRNVYITDGAPPGKPAPQIRGRLLEAVADRARFFAQFWIGVAAWPAIIQYRSELPPPPEKDKAAHGNGADEEVGHPLLGLYQRQLPERQLNVELSNSDKSPDLGWMYTVIAGVLNILVIYDALAGPAHGPARAKSGARPSMKEAAVA